MKRHAPRGLPYGAPYTAVGMQRALDSAIGLPRRSTSASRMLVFLIPAEEQKPHAAFRSHCCRREHFLVCSVHHGHQVLSQRLRIGTLERPADRRKLIGFFADAAL